MSEFSQRLEEIVRLLQAVQLSLENVKGSVQVLVQTSADHEHRLRKVERFQNSLTPMVAAVTFVLGLLIRVAFDRLF